MTHSGVSTCISLAFTTLFAQDESTTALGAITALVCATPFVYHPLAAGVGEIGPKKDVQVHSLHPLCHGIRH